MSKIAVGSTRSHDQTRLANIFMDTRSKAQKFEVCMSDNGKTRTHYAWTIFEACEVATDFVKTGKGQFVYKID